MDEETKVEGTCACGSDKKTEDCCGTDAAPVEETPAEATPAEEEAPQA